EALRGLEISVSRDQLPKAAPGAFYWVDLEGMQVVNTEGLELGRVSHLVATGANDVVVVRGCETEHLIPFVRPDYVTGVDMEARVLTVDWDPGLSWRRAHQAPVTPYCAIQFPPCESMWCPCSPGSSPSAPPSA